jgi:hypothetical protein
MIKYIFCDGHKSQLNNHFSILLYKSISQILIASCNLVFCISFAQTPQATPAIQSASGNADLKPNQVDVYDIDAEVKTFNEKALRFHILFTNTVANILTIYADPGDVSKWAEQVNLVKAASDAKLQAEVLKSVIPVLSRELQNLTSDPGFTARTQLLSAEGMKQLRSSTMSFIVLAVQSRGIFESGKKIIGSAESKPENLPKIISVKDFLPLLTVSMTTLSASLPKISNAVKTQSNSSQGKTSEN